MSGVAALLRDFDRNLIGDDFAEIMKRSAKDLYQDLYSPGRDDESGYGLLRADMALKLINPYSPYRKRLERAQLDPVEIDSDYQVRSFWGFPELPDVEYDTIRHRWQATHTFATPFVSSPPVVAWYRNSGTNGWLNDGPSDNETDRLFDPPSHARIVSLTSESITLETYVFEVYDQDGGLFMGYFPDGPPQIAFTALGTISASDAIGVGEEGSPIRVAHVEAAPNPGLGHIRFLVESPGSGLAALSIYDSMGRLVRMMSEKLPAGESTLLWDGRSNSGVDVTNGVYFYRLRLDGQSVRIDRVLLLR